MMKSKASAENFGNSPVQDDSSSGSDFSNSDDVHFTKTTSSSSSSSLRSCESMTTTIKSPTPKYTSLRDILPASPTSPLPPPSPAPMTPPATTPVHGSSWTEIPIAIRDPLVKQAALAYLQPMVSRPELVEQGLFGKLKEVCCGGGQCGCFEWLNGVVLEVVGDVFRNKRDEDDEDEDDDDNDDDDRDEEDARFD